ncbi:MAG: hypothetical protein ACLFTE_07095 [Salinivenus sp.]
MRPFSLRAVRGGLLAALLCAVTGALMPAVAQSNGNGSIYSRYGLGSLETFSSSQSQALGGGGYALRSLNYNPMGNPALWSDQVFTRLSAGGTFERTQATGAQDRSSQLSSGSFEAVQFNFPLYERSLGVGLSLQPYSLTNFRVRRTMEDPDGSLPAYEVNYQGTGGLYSFRGGLGYEVSEALRVGAALDVIFGIVESQRRTEFNATSESLRNTVVSDATRLSGLSGTLGAHASFTDVLSDEDAVSVGAAVELPTTVDGRRVRTLDEDLARDTLSNVRGDASLPWRSRLGLAYQPDERWTIVLDGTYEPWSDFSTSFDEGGESQFGRQFPVGGEGTLTDRWRLSAGAEHIPGGDGDLRGFFSRIGYRLGAYTEQLYVQPEGKNVQEYATTGGLSLPTSLPGTRIDINLRAGVREPRSGSFVRDVFYGASVHVNFGERWFQKRRLR